MAYHQSHLRLQSRHIFYSYNMSLGQPTKYLKLVGELLSLFQRQLVKYIKKHPYEISPEFPKLLTISLSRLKQAELQKGIEDAVSPHCSELADFLKEPAEKGQAVPRLNKTSIQTRKNLRSQAGSRMMRMTGNLRRSHQQPEAIIQQAEFKDIIESYKIEEELVPRMRMKWKSAYEPEGKTATKEISTIGSNNIDLLSYTIPQIENSIRRLSYQKSPKSVKEQMDFYRTLESKSNKKKYIPRLF